MIYGLGFHAQFRGSRRGGRGDALVDGQIFDFADERISSPVDPRTDDEARLSYGRQVAGARRGAHGAAVDLQLQLTVGMAHEADRSRLPLDELHLSAVDRHPLVGMYRSYELPVGLDEQCDRRLLGFDDVAPRACDFAGRDGGLNGKALHVCEAGIFR